MLQRHDVLYGADRLSLKLGLGNSRVFSPRDVYRKFKEDRCKILDGTTHCES